MINFQTKNGACFKLLLEQEADKPYREILLDATMGRGRKRKSSEALRRGRLAAQGLSFVVKNALGELVGSVRLWHVSFLKEKNETQHVFI